MNARFFFPAGLALVLLAGAWVLSLGGDGSRDSEKVEGERREGSFGKDFAAGQDETAETRLQREPHPAFVEWLERYRAASPPSREKMVEEGRILADARRDAMYELIAEDPAQALEQTLSLRDYALLPTSVAKRVESPESGLGDIDLLWETKLGPEGEVHCFDRNRLALKGSFFDLHGPGRRDGQKPSFSVPVFTYLLEDRALVPETPVLFVDGSEAEAAARFFEEDAGGFDPLTGRSVEKNGPAAVIAGTLYRFSSEGSRANVRDAIVSSIEEAQENRTYQVKAPFDWLAGDSVGGFQSTTANSFFDDDDISVLFIRCDFSDFSGAAVSQADLLSDLNAVSGHLNEMSYGTASLTPTVTSTVYRAPDTGASYAQAGDNDSLYADVVAAYDAAPEAGPSSSYDVVAIFFPDLEGVANSQITYGGLASVGGSRMWINGVSFSSGRISVITHEFGHNYGLYHSNYWHPEQSLSGEYYGSPAFSLEYGDIFDLMGSADPPEGHFNPYQKAKIDWLPENQIATATGDATYRIYRFDHIDAPDNPLLAVRVPMETGVTYWIGHRQLFDSNPNLETGAYVVAEGLYQDRPNLIDMTPGSEPDESSDRFDAALPEGQTYLSATAGVEISTTAVGSNGPEDEWIEVTLDFDPRIGFVDTFYEFEEASGTAYVTVERTFDTTGAVTVDYATSDTGTALAGTDYYPASGTLTWADGESGQKTITVPLRPDEVQETGESFEVTLSNPTSGIIVSGAETATVSILDPGERYVGFAPDFFNNAVNSVDFQSGGEAIIAGTIDHVSGEFSGTGNIARLETDGTVDPTFNSGGSGFDGEVETVVVQPDDKILVGGDFSSYNGMSVPRLVRLNSDGSLDTNFLTQLGAGPNGTVWTIALEADGDILVGGSFDSFSGTAAEGLFRLSADGSVGDPLHLPFEDSFSSRVRDIEVLDDGDLLVTGGFYVGWTGSGFRSGILRLNPDGTRDPGFDPDAGLHLDGDNASLRTGYALGIRPDGDILVGGTFTAFDDFTTSRFARVDSDGSFDAAGPVTFSSTVAALQVEPFGGVLVGKWGDANPDLYRIREDWTLDNNFTALGGPYGSVYDIQHASDGSLWVGGNFFDYNGEASRPVVRLASGLSPYDLWALQNFTNAQRAAGVADPTEDPDGDGIANIGELAIGSDPNFADASSLFGGSGPGTLTLAEAGGQTYLELSFDKSALDGGVWYAVQVSSDLVNWSPDPPIPGDDTAYEILEDSESRLVIRDRTPVSEDAPRFVRVVLVDPN